MKGIASLLDHSAEARVRNLWQELESTCGLVGVKSALFPHFTWQVTENYDRQNLDLVLREFSRKSVAFKVRTEGLGLFTGKKPVIYLPLFKDETLNNFHARLWELTRQVSVQPWQFYAPDRWVPHITLAYNDVTSLNLACAIQSLAFQNFNWEIEINNLAFFEEAEDQSSRMVRYEFGK